MTLTERAKKAGIAIRRSKTMLFAVSLAVLGVLEQSRGALEPVLKEHAGLVFVGIAAAIAVLRALTTTSLLEKAGSQDDPQ